MTELLNDSASTGLSMSLIEAAHKLLKDSLLLDRNELYVTFNFETEVISIYNDDEKLIAWRHW